jgi:hypothetical protein
VKHDSLLKLGGLCAILLGIVNGLSSIFYLLLPPEQRAAVPAAQILPSVAEGATLLMITFYAQAIVGVLGLIVVPAISVQFKDMDEGWVRWTRNLALVGFAVSAVGYLLSAGRLPGIAAAFVAGDASTKAALAAVWKSSIDLQGFWGYGAVGIWVFVMSLFALRGSSWPKPAAYLGLVLGIAYWLIPVGVVLKSQPFLLLGSAIGAVLTTIWYVWVGWVTRSASTKQTSEATPMAKASPAGTGPKR